MDKDQMDKLRADIRLTLQAINDNLLELNDYLARLRAETVAQVDQAIQAGIVEAGIIEDLRLRARDTTGDARHPYQNQRQPRRDGDSFGSVLPHDDNSPGTVRPAGKR